MSASAPIATVPCPVTVDWPREEGHLDDVGMELWWLTSLLQAGERRLSTFLLVFRIDPETVLVNAVVTDLQTGVEMATRQAYPRAEVGLTQNRLELVAPLARYSGSFEDGYRVTADIDEDTGFELTMQPVNPILFNCGSGEFAMGQTTTKQCGMGGLTTVGTVRLGGNRLEVTGASWYDRQWFVDALPAGSIDRFTWLGIWLDNGDTISLWDRTVDDPEEQSWATVVRADGTHVVAAVPPVAGGATGTITTHAGHEVPSGWTVHIPGLAATLEITQSVVQDDPTQSFFTGALEVRGTYEGAPVTGRGVCDLVDWWAE